MPNNGQDIKPGMAVETTDDGLGERDISKPRVRDVARDERGHFKMLSIQTGVIFRNKMEIPAERIHAVQSEPRTGEPQSELTTAAADDEVSGLRLARESVAQTLAE